jgi:uncharacterized protein
MRKTLAPFWTTLIAVWALGGIGGLLYAQYQHIPGWAVRAALPAFLLEASFYLAPGFEAVRDRLQALGSRAALAIGIVVSALLPYVVASAGMGQFRWRALGALTAFAAAVTLWYLLLPRSLATDLLFLGLVAGVFVSKTFQQIYVSPFEKLPLDILGRLAWIRMGVCAALFFRRMDGIGFGFVPERREWAVGARYYLYLLLLVAPLAFALGFVHRPAQLSGKTVLVAVLTFCGVLWVLALGEEFFFRGLLQQWLARLLSNQRAGLLAASVVFGLCHIGFRQFPNWRFVLLASVAGVFYGMAYARTGSIRASMVTHALTVTTWRVFLA